MEDIKSKLDGVRDFQEKFELYAMISLIFYCGFKKQEIMTVKIGDVIAENHRPWSRFCQKAIDDYLAIIKDNSGGTLDSNSPLFPSYLGRAGERKFSRHLKNNCGDINYVTILNEGIKYTSAELYDDDWQGNVEEVAGFYKVSEDKIKRLLRHGSSRQQHKMNSEDNLRRIMDELTYMNFPDKKIFREKIKEALNYIDKMKKTNEQKEKMKQGFCRFVKTKYREKEYSKKQKAPTHKKRESSCTDEELKEELFEPVEKTDQSKVLQKTFFPEHFSDDELNTQELELKKTFAPIYELKDEKDVEK